MKLYDEFVKLVETKEYGELKKAWFTTFTISPDFVERYVLPTILGFGNDLPKTPSQFEAINAALVDSGKDIRFFYDAKMPIEGFKRTTVNFQGVFWKTGLYHPKVTLIEFEKCSFLMAGSANLGISGWGRNREAVTIKEIGVRQANQIKSFFQLFTVDITAPRATKPAKSWDFIYRNLAYELKNEEKELYVWSPYFSSKLEDLSKELFPGHKVNIIPDRPNGKIRLEEVPDSDNLSFYNDIKSREEMTHAKVWLTPNKIAIGSHNFTGAALEDRNLEASIVDGLDQYTFDAFVHDLEDIESPTGMTGEELKEEALPENYYTVPVHIEANWQTRTIDFYFIDGEARKLNEYLPWKLYLPGNVEHEQKEKIHGNCNSYSIQLNTKQLIECFNALLTDRMFYIDSPSKTIASGYIEEVEASSLYRSPHRYTKLHDFFLDSLIGVDPNDSSRTYLPQEGDSELQTDNKFASKIRGFGYFELFEIFKKIRTRITETKDITLLKHAVLYAPNSLVSLKELIQKEVQQSNQKTALYNWFMVYEFNDLIEEVRSDDIKINGIKGIKINLSYKDKKFISSVLNIQKGTL